MQAPTLQPVATRTYTRDELASLWQRARERAAIEHTRAWRVDGSIWVSSTQLDANDGAATHYTVVVLGSGPFDTACTCRAAQFGAPCKHRAATALAIQARQSSIIMAQVPSAAAAHCCNCGRWFAVQSDTELYCSDCR